MWHAHQMCVFQLAKFTRHIFVENVTLRDMSSDIPMLRKPKDNVLKVLLKGIVTLLGGKTEQSFLVT